ncbi:MAG TPA: MFS transporter, partial [Pyrinomonadaceae bacterium]|nr:MFS transporter [Pyrinomonadaceae bacterium]
AYTSYLPTLVQRERLIEGNTKLEVSRSLAQITGPSLGGVLTQLLTAPIAIIFDALSFLTSGLFLAFIRKTEPPPVPQSERRNIWVEIGEGLRVVWTNPVLRALVMAAATANLFANMNGTVYVLYATRELLISPAIIGLIYGIGSLGGLLGALMAGRFVKWFGLGQTIVGAQVMAGVGALLIPLVGGQPMVVAILLTVAQTLWIFAVIIHDINALSLRQAITPDRLLGRVGATARFVAWGTMPLGALLGGALGEMFGLRPTLMLAGLGVLLASLWILLSPLRTLHEQPATTSHSALVASEVV